MPKVKTKKTKAPEGFDEIEPKLKEFDREMREAENETTDGKSKNEITWPLTRVHHKRSRFVYELYYKRKEISKELYEFLLREGYAEGNLIAKWKKQGYEKLCCLSCIQTKDHNFQTTCICRVPKSDRSQKHVQCKACGCKGCASGD